MRSTRTGGRLGAVLAVAAAALAAAGCDGSKSPGPRSGTPTGGTKGSAQPPFAESAAERGIAFQMHFLPGEQGEKFKINLYDHGCAVCVSDYDDDGDDDLLFLNQLGPNALYRNDGGRFTDVSAKSGVMLSGRISVGAAFGDVDSDGDQDLFITTTRAGNVLLRNDGGDRFTDVSAAAGVGLVGHSETPTFFDFDGDGDLDLFVTNTAKWTWDVRNAEGKYFEGRSTLMELVDSVPEPNVLYRNDGGLKFTDVTAAAGVGGTKGWGGDTAVFDYDDDGDLDFFVGNMFGNSVLYRNDGGGKFADATREVLGDFPWGAMGARVFDYDDDGRLDLAIVDMHSDMWISVTSFASDVDARRRYTSAVGPTVERGLLTKEEAAQMIDKLKVPESGVVFGNALYHNEGGGKFQDRSPAANFETFWPWGIAAADFDLDGDQDAYIPAGMGHPFFYWRSEYLVNQGDGTFQAGASKVGIDPPPGGIALPERIGGHEAPKSARAAAVGDFDQDGRPDLVVNNFNDRAHLFMNRFPQRNWAGVRLRATKGHRDAIGATVTIKAGGRTMVRQVPAVGGYLAQNSLSLHFGLGDATAIESCVVRWPGGATQTVTGVQANRMNYVSDTGKVTDQPGGPK